MKHWIYRYTIESIIVSLWALAAVGLSLFLLGLAEWGGILPRNGALHVCETPIKTDTQYRVFIMGTGIISCLGWLFIYLHITGRVVIRQSSRIFHFPESPRKKEAHKS